MDLNALTQQMAALQGSYVDPTTEYNNVFNSLGGTQAQQRVSSLATALQNNENLITGLPTSILQRTQNSDVTAGQNQRINAMEVAPLNTQETQLTGQHNQAQADFGNIETNATNQANLYQTGYTTKRDTLAAQIAVAQKAAADAEAQREYNQTLALQKQQAATAAAKGGGGSGGSSAAAKGPTYQQRSGGGYNFQNAGGAAISARLYAQLTGTNFNTLLKQMAASGDAGAKDVLAHGASSSAYKALTWD